jgi:hypothetical protein
MSSNTIPEVGPSLKLLHRSRRSFVAHLAARVFRRHGCRSRGNRTRRRHHNHCAGGGIITQMLKYGRLTNGAKDSDLGPARHTLVSRI